MTFRLAVEKKQNTEDDRSFLFECNTNAFEVEILAYQINTNQHPLCSAGCSPHGYKNPNSIGVNINSLCQCCFTNFKAAYNLVKLSNIYNT